ncbi:hypothetical protein F4819DRAFT_504532 [Hypoxylon fuscum]|nr:hypothetical protein F4819DRAFT_504532 [Hypoxylon fuscum]
MAKLQDQQKEQQKEQKKEQQQEQKQEQQQEQQQEQPPYSIALDGDWFTFCMLLFILVPFLFLMVEFTPSFGFEIVYSALTVACACLFFIYDNVRQLFSKSRRQLPFSGGE